MWSHQMWTYLVWLNFTCLVGKLPGGPACPAQELTCPRQADRGFATPCEVIKWCSMLTYFSSGFHHMFTGWDTCGLCDWSIGQQTHECREKESWQRQYRHQTLPNQEPPVDFHQLPDWEPGLWFTDKGEHDSESEGLWIDLWTKWQVHQISMYTYSIYCLVDSGV